GTSAGPLWSVKTLVDGNHLSGYLTVAGSNTAMVMTQSEVAVIKDAGPQFGEKMIKALESIVPKGNITRIPIKYPTTPLVAPDEFVPPRVCEGGCTTGDDMEYDI
ncbi:hypothetical protein KIPB_008322, partial [Kipferlia bialata]